MADVTDIEKEFRINLSAPDFDVVRAIEVGMQIEQKGRKFYLDSMNKVSEPLKPFLKFLASQEREHEADLNDVKKTLQSMNIWVKLPPTQIQEPLRNFSVFKKHPGTEHRDNVQDIQVILTAIDMEKKTRDFYMRFSEKVKSADGRAFFKSLADWERKHYDLLSGIYNAESYVRLET